MQERIKKYLIVGGVATVVVTLAGIASHKFIESRKYRSKSDRQKEKEAGRLIGKNVHYGSEGYVNVRTAPKVDNQNPPALDFSDNILAQVQSNPVGTILERIKGEDGYFWYRIGLTRPLGGKTGGYVREDAVKIQF